jgi:hypothetical protein
MPIGLPPNREGAAAPSKIKKLKERGYLARDMFF